MNLLSGVRKDNTVRVRVIHKMHEGSSVYLLERGLTFDFELPDSQSNVGKSPEN